MAVAIPLPLRCLRRELWNLSVPNLSCVQEPTRDKSDSLLENTQGLDFAAGRWRFEVLSDGCSRLEDLEAAWTAMINTSVGGRVEMGFEVSHGNERFAMMGQLYRNAGKSGSI